METRRPNQNNPFGSYGDAETEVRRPQDITSDQWTPISAGSKPTDRTPKGARLTDSDLLMPDVPQKEKTAPVPQRKRPPKKRGKKSRRGEKKAATLPQPPNRQSQRPVVQGTHRDYAAARTRREQEHAERQATRAEEKYHRQRADGKSGDELRLQKAVRSRRGKRLMAGLVVGAILLVAMIAITGYAFFYGIPVEKINVTGADDTIYSREEILEKGGVSVGNNIFTVWRTRDEIVQRICSALPYIASARVTVKFPDTVTLTVTPNAERFIVSMPGSTFCLDRNDKVISLKAKKQKPGKVRLKGFALQQVTRGAVFAPTEENAPRLEKAKEIAAEAESIDLQALLTIDLTDLNNVILCIDARVNVYLGKGELLQKKLPLIAKMYQSNFPAGATGYIDASFEGRYYYKVGTMERSGSS